MVPAGPLPQHLNPKFLPLRNPTGPFPSHTEETHLCVLFAELETVAAQLVKDARVSDAAAVQLANGVVAFVVLTEAQGKNGNDSLFLKV
jgi:hypothetical protein